MTQSDVEFLRLMEGVRARDAGAYAELQSGYGNVIRAAVRRHLRDRLRPHFDSLDFVQDVWASFVALSPDQCTFASPDSLGGFLSRVARNKVVEAYRKRVAARKRDPAREVSLDAGTGTRSPAEADARAATPSQVAIAGERWAVLLAKLPAGHHAILEQLRDGYTHDEVAVRLGVSRSTVERIVRRLKDLCGR